MTSVLGSGAADAAAPIVVPEHGVVGRTRSTELPIGLDENFDGDACDSECKHADAQGDELPIHGTKVQVGLNR